MTQQGGRLEASYYAYGGDDFLIIADTPDSVTTSAVSLAVNATGAVSSKTIMLTTPEEVDAAVKKSISYRPLDSKVNVNTQVASEGTGPMRPETIRPGSVPLTPLWKI